MPVSPLTSPWGGWRSWWAGSRTGERADKAGERAHELVSAEREPISPLMRSWGDSRTRWDGSRIGECGQRAGQPVAEPVNRLTIGEHAVLAGIAAWPATCRRGRALEVDPLETLRSE